MDEHDKNLDEHIDCIKLNEVDITRIINNSYYSILIKDVLKKIYDKFFNIVFDRSDIVSYLGVAKSSASNYINYLIQLNIVEYIKGRKYRFRYY